MTLKTMPISALAAASACLFLSVAQAAAPPPEQDPLAEIVISATLRSTALNELPASATVLDAHTLERAGVEHFGDVLGLVPNLNWAGGTSRPRYFQLRGIGELEQYEGAPNPSVGFLIDDIDFSGVAMPATLFDAAKVEVLRGPQGTAYGANALAGLISLTTQAPRDEFELRLAADLGDYGVRGGGAVLNDTLGDQAAYRIVGHAYRGDGFRRDAFLGRNDTNGFDEHLLRGKLRAQLGRALSVDLTAMFAAIDNGYDAWTLDNSRVTLSDKPGRDAQRSRALAARLEYELDFATLRSTTSFADSDIHYAFDGDWANDEFWGVNGPYDFTERIIRNRRSASQELRAVSRSADAPVRWVAGIYALRLSEGNDLLDLYNGDVYRSLVSDYAATNLALYGQLDIDLSRRLAVSMGLRSERRDARYTDSDAQRFDPVDSMMGGHLALTFKLREGRDLYAALTRGYKAGGFNTGGAVPQHLKLFAPEFLWNLETGLKTRSVDGRFDGQVSLFYMLREDSQVSSSYQADPANPLDFVLLTDNAARGENFGLEGQLGWRPLPGLRLGSTLGLLKARFVEYELAGVSLAGRDQAHAPHYQFSVSADYRFAQGFFARADVTGTDDFYFSASHDKRSTSYQLVNLRLGYEARNWVASLWARNVFDEQYYVRGFYFANEPGLGPKLYLDNGEPRQFGLSVSLSF